METIYVVRLDELKKFVMEQTGVVAVKIGKLTDETSKKILMVQRLTKIREMVDQITQEFRKGLIDPTIGKNPSQDQQRQNEQVKQTLTELKKTYQTNLLEVTQKLEEMGMKQDAVMDMMELGHNDILLELSKTPKIKDMNLYKPQEKPMAKLVQMQITKLEICSPQKSPFNLGINNLGEIIGQINNHNHNVCSNCKSLSRKISEEEKKQETPSISGKYSEQIMKLLQEKGHPNTYERFKMRRQQETEWRYKQYDDNVYEGEFLKGTDIRDGQGLMILNDGDVYEGQWENDEQHGYGEYYWNRDQCKGDYYQGQWSEGNWNGYGVKHYNNGCKYQGEWKDDNKHGLGIWHYQNKDIEIGYYINHKPNGQHVKITPDNRIYQFTYAKGKLIKEKKLASGCIQYQ